MSDLILRIAGLEPESIVDGPGLRFTVFVQGCPHHCPGCHNPQSHDFSGGKERSVQEIFAQIAKNPLITGVTFSGGEPFCQPKSLAVLAEKIKTTGLELAVYTGFFFEDLICDPSSDEFALLRLTDTLIDGPFLQDKRDISLDFRGSSNQRIIDVPASLTAGHVVLDTSSRWNISLA